MAKDKDQKPEKEQEQEQENTSTIEPNQKSFMASIFKHRKVLLLLYILMGCVLFYKITATPDLKNPYLIEIFNQ